MKQQNLMLRGLLAPVRLSGEGWNAGDFSEFLPNWPFEIVDVTDATPFATLERTDHGFVFSSDFGDGPAPHASLVNTVCDLIAHAARQRTRERPDNLCLHASAVQVGEGLVVMPATRRAGKSVMTAVLGARGHGVFSDDVLPISALSGAPIVGRATGASIRLRLPLPEQLPPAVRDHIEAHAGSQNRQYLYVPSPVIADQDASAPLCAFVSIDYASDAETEFVEVSRGKMLKSLLKQNFSRDADGDQILAALFHMVEHLPCYLLRYSDVVAAAQALETAFANGDAPSLMMPVLPPVEDVELGWGDSEPDQPLVRRAQATVVDLEGEAFGVSADQRNIDHLDTGALRVLGLFDVPTREREVVDILSAAFPTVDAAQIENDVSGAVRRFRRAGLLVAT